MNCYICLMDISNENIFLTSYINSFLMGARLDRISEVYDDTFEFVFYLSGQGKRYMYLSFNRNKLKCAILNEQGLGVRRPPSSLVMGLRKYLINSRINDVEYYKNSETVLIYFSSKNTSGTYTLLLNRNGLVLFDSKKNILYSLKDKKKVLPVIEPFNDLPEISIEQADEIFKKTSLLISQENFDKKKNRLLKLVRRKMKYFQKILDKIEADRNRFLRYNELLKKGELLKGQFHKIKKGMEFVELDDYFNQNAIVKIDLDPVLSPAENVAKIFKTSKKYKRGLEKIKERDSGIKKSFLEFCELENSILNCQEVELKDFEKKAETLGIKLDVVNPVKDKNAIKKSSLPYRLIEKKDVDMYIGKNARGNEYVTFRIASGNDLWFHTHNYPGSHLVLKRKNKSYKYTANDIKEAAIAALYYSTAKKYFREEVVYTEAKNVKNMKGSAPGQVSLAAGKTIIVSLEEDEVKKALRSKILHT